MNATLNASVANLSTTLLSESPLHHYHVATDDIYVPSAPAWMVEFVEFRQRLFLQTVEPIIVRILGPVLSAEEIARATSLSGTDTSISSSQSSSSSWFRHEESLDQAAAHRRLGFLPDYVENAASFRDTSMSFATLITLFVTMTCILLIFLSCFYHNQKTSPLFISPRRHRLPKLVPPPLPVEGYFDWVSLI